MQEGKHILTLTERKQLRAEAVEKIEYLSPQAVAALSSCGRLVVRGKELFVESLDKEAHVLLIKGEIEEIIYSDPETGKNILRKLFK